MTEIITAYKFLRDDRRSGMGNEPPWGEGETRSVKGEIIPCERGYHASPTPWDALRYAPGSALCVVRLSGDLMPHGNPVDKYAARTCEVVRIVNVARELRLFAADCAERVLPIFERNHPDDDRPRKAIEAARAYARGEITIKRLDAARAAAEDAAEDAAWAAARDAARGAARDAARAAWDAARVARGAARDDVIAMLEARLFSAMKITDPRKEND